MSRGSLFHTLGAALTNALSPKVFFAFALLSTSNIPLFDRKLYLKLYADRFSGYTGVRDILEPDPNSYGVDLNSPFSHADDTVEVEVTEVNNPLTTDEFERLGNTVDPLTQSSQYGVDLFIKTAYFVADVIMQR